MLFAPFSSPCTLFSRSFCAKNRHFAPFSLSIYLVAHDFCRPQKRHLVAKNLLFEVVFAPKGQFFFIHSTVINFSKNSKKQQYDLHFAPFSLAFSRSQHCVQHELALRLVGVSTAFCCIQQAFLLQIAPKYIKKTVVFNKKSTYHLKSSNPIFTETNLREN